jgi:hypothetical protein
MGKRGPKLTEVDWELCRNLLRIQCTGEEIAGAMGISYDTLERACKRDHGIKFAEYSELKRAEGRASLRRAQWKAAQEGNPTMLVWLGKQMLGQRDKVDVDNTSSDGSMTPQVVERVIVNPQKAE